MTVYGVPETVKAILFDIDGTLYSSSEYGEKQSELVLRELSRVRGVTYEAITEELERVRAEYASNNGGAKTSLGNAMIAMGVDMATSVAWRLRLLRPGDYLSIDYRLRATLSMITARGIVLVAVTNNPRRVGEDTLVALGVRDAFRAVVGLDDTMRSKPAPEPYLLAASIAATEPVACLSVGDRYDIDLAVPLDLGMGGVLVDGVADVYALPELLFGVSAQ